MNWELPDVQDGFRKDRRTRDQTANICWIMEKTRGFQKNIHFCCTMLKLLCGPQQSGKFLKRWEYQTTVPASRETCMQIKKQRSELDMEQWICSKLGKVYVKAVHCHLVHLTYRQSTSREMPGCMKYKLESRLPGEMSITSDMQMMPPLWWKVKRK